MIIIREESSTELECYLVSITVDPHVTGTQIHGLHLFNPLYTYGWLVPTVSVRDNDGSVAVSDWKGNRTSLMKA